MIRSYSAFVAILLALVLGPSMGAQDRPQTVSGQLPLSQSATTGPAPDQAASASAPGQSVAAQSAAAQPPPATHQASAAGLPLPDDPTVYIGKTIAEVMADRGVPHSMAAIRGPEVWQDDVEFSWGDGSHFDWYADRVWRIDFDKDYKGSVFGIFIGDSSDKALSLLGQPHFTAADGLVWRLPWRGYPVQLRLTVKDGIVTDIAVFRADL
ncbi:MAG TPA: hypothetical protein VMV44_09205 [Rectinemataceae bacterium]|nr:hypothetical protein [Rectinemataceae bacterium]